MPVRVHARLHVRSTQHVVLCIVVVVVGGWVGCHSQEDALRDCGVADVYVGSSARLPRVSFIVPTAGRCAVEVDACFCRVPASALPSDTRVETPVPTVDALTAMPLDTVSATALQGPAFLARVLRDTLHLDTAAVTDFAGTQ